MALKEAQTDTLARCLAAGQTLKAAALAAGCSCATAKRWKVAVSQQSGASSEERPFAGKIRNLHVCAARCYDGFKTSRSHVLGNMIDSFYNRLQAVLRADGAWIETQ